MAVIVWLKKYIYKLSGIQKWGEFAIWWLLRTFQLLLLKRIAFVFKITFLRKKEDLENMFIIETL